MGSEHRYTVSMEVSGAKAMWTRPETGSCMVSYPAPTFSAVKGIFESVHRILQADVIPVKCEVCRPVVYTTRMSNYGGPLRKTSLLRSGSGYQMVARMLLNVCYRLYVVVIHKELPDNMEFKQQPRALSSNGGHALQAILDRKLNRGQCFKPICLGLSNCAVDYFGPLRDDTEPCEDVNVDLRTMLKTPHGPKDSRGIHTAEFYQNVRIEKGVLAYA